MQDLKVLYNFKQRNDVQTIQQHANYQYFPFTTDPKCNNLVYNVALPYSIVKAYTIIQYNTHTILLNNTHTHYTIFFLSNKKKRAGTSWLSPWLINRSWGRDPELLYDCIERRGALSWRRAALPAQDRENVQTSQWHCPARLQITAWQYKIALMLQARNHCIVKNCTESSNHSIPHPQSDKVLVTTDQQRIKLLV